ncbi:methyltransferase [Planotetraspora sp. GP83]|uniref:methyltransferase n=1 Tax=Planotetraspora sp. GP83 TaxID=3156264 RepID=UPI003511E810
MPVRPRVDIQAVTELTELADYIVPFAIRVMCDMSVADQLVDGPRPVEEIAAATGAHAPTLLRAMRALAGRGIFTELDPGTFALTPLAEPLRSDHPFSVRECFPLMPPDVRSWARLTGAIRTGHTAFDDLYGTGYYDWCADHPYECDRFERSAESVNPLVLRTVVPAVDWSGITTLVDVGGGHGTFVAGVLRRNPAMSAILFDLPHVAEHAPAVLAEAGVADRCEARGGDFFSGDIPPGADAYLMKTILHDWPDERASAILRAVRAAMREDSRLLVIESVRTPGDGWDVGKVMDVKALALFGGHTRTEEEFAGLFAGAGLRLASVTQTPTMSVIEGSVIEGEAL